MQKLTFGLIQAAMITSLSYVSQGCMLLQNGYEGSFEKSQHWTSTEGSHNDCDQDDICIFQVTSETIQL